MLQNMNHFTQSICNKAAKLQCINLDYINQYFQVLCDAKNSKEESTMNKVVHSNKKISVLYYA